MHLASAACHTGQSTLRLQQPTCIKVQGGVQQLKGPLALSQGPALQNKQQRGEQRSARFHAQTALSHHACSAYHPNLTTFPPVQVALCRRSMMEAEAALSELRHEVAGLRTELALSERLRIAMACSVGFKQKGHTSSVHHALSGCGYQVWQAEFLWDRPLHLPAWMSGVRQG